MRRTGQNREHVADLAGHGLEGIDLHDLRGGLSAQGEVAEQDFLQGELKHSHAAVGVDKLVERREEGVELL